METSLMQSLRDKVGLNFDKGFPVKIHIVLLLSLIRKECLTLNLKEEMEVVLLFLDLHVPNVGRNMMVSAYPTPKSGHKMRYCSMLKVKGREDKQAPPSGSNSNASKKNCFYAI